MGEIYVMRKIRPTFTNSVAIYYLTLHLPEYFDIFSFTVSCELSKILNSQVKKITYKRIVKCNDKKAKCNNIIQLKLHVWI